MTSTVLNETSLDALLTAPSPALVSDMANLAGDIIILGAGGKMGPTLCLLARNALKSAGSHARVIAVSRFTDDNAARLLSDNDIETIARDLLDVKALAALPKAPNVIYMAGRKFGTSGSEHLTWGMNAVLPALVSGAFKDSDIVVFSSGNIYPPAPLSSGGCREETLPGPVGEYAMSCLARERVFEYAARAYGTRVLLYRLNYAVDLRYGVLCDIAEKLIAGEAVSLDTPVFNIIWQGFANEIALRGLRHCACPPLTLNVTGPETISVQYAAERMANILGVRPIFTGEPRDTAILSNASRAIEMFGYPPVSAGQMIEWQAHWFLNNNRRLNKPTHFEERGGNY